MKTTAMAPSSKCIFPLMLEDGRRKEGSQSRSSVDIWEAGNAGMFVQWLVQEFG